MAPAPWSYQWTKNGTNLVDGGNLSGSTSPSLTLTNVSQSDVASYSVVVTGSGSISSAPAMLTVLIGTPTITLQPQDAANNAGTIATFSVEATGLAPLTSINGSKMALCSRTAAMLRERREVH